MAKCLGAKVPIPNRLLQIVQALIDGRIRVGKARKGHDAKLPEGLRPAWIVRYDRYSLQFGYYSVPERPS